MAGKFTRRKTSQGLRNIAEEMEFAGTNDSGPPNPIDSRYVSAETEIEEENSSIAGELQHGSRASDEENGEDVYVAVTKSNSSMEALQWTLKNIATQSTFVYLIHVFPEVHQIPTLCKLTS